MLTGFVHFLQDDNLTSPPVLDRTSAARTLDVVVPVGRAVGVPVALFKLDREGGKCVCHDNSKISGEDSFLHHLLYYTTATQPFHNCSIFFCKNFPTLPQDPVPAMLLCHEYVKCRKT